MNDKLKWCLSCGEGVTTFCRGNRNNEPIWACWMGLPDNPRKRAPDAAAPHVPSVKWGEPKSDSVNCEPRVIDKSELKRLVTQVFGEDFQIVRQKDSLDLQKSTHTDREQIVEMARSAGYDLEAGERIGESSDMQLFTRFAQLAADRALEQAAVLCDSMSSPWRGSEDCAQAIRAKKGSP